MISIKYTAKVYFGKYISALGLQFEAKFQNMDDLEILRCPNLVESDVGVIMCHRNTMQRAKNVERVIKVKLREMGLSIYNDEPR